MPSNQAQDRYNPPQAGDPLSDFEESTFDSLNVGELFWLKPIIADEYHCYRKLSDTAAYDTKSGRTLDVEKKNATVYYKM